MNIGIGLHGGKEVLEEFQNISQSFISETKTQCEPNVPSPTEIQNLKVFDSSLTEYFVPNQVMITNKMNENKLKKYVTMKKNIFLYVSRIRISR